MTKIIEKIVVKKGCEQWCEYVCNEHNTYKSKETIEVLFQGTYEECMTKAYEINDYRGKEHNFEHCYYTSSDHYS